jgi:2-polyprenyl-3-methyl-5-hydroxy-6-metoxy-1,4-benzoquinol methylase
LSDRERIYGNGQALYGYPAYEEDRGPGLIALLVRKARLFPFGGQKSAALRYFSWAARGQIYFRWFSCPFEMLRTYVPAHGVVYDLGCGHGILLQWLASVMPEGVRFEGLDIDHGKIGMAKAANRRERLTFSVEDITSDLAIRDASAVILNDVLHLIKPEQQKKLLSRCHGYLLPQGVLLIKEIERAASWKYGWAFFQEALVNHVFRLTRGSGLYYASRRDSVDALTSAGFNVTVISAQQGYPYPHIIYYCRKV